MRSTNRNSSFIKSLFLCLVSAVTIGMVGCAPQGGRGPAPSTPPRPAYLEHTVRYSGETLAVISGWYTGSNQNWKQIIDANPGLRPERMRLGQLILIPKSLVVKDAPLPEGYVRRFAGRSVEKVDSAAGSEGGAESTDGTATATTTTATEPAQDSSVTPVATESGSADVGTAAVAVDGAASVVPTDNAISDSGAAVGNSTAEPSPSTSPEATPPGPSEADKERERLLDELLKQ